MQVEVLPQPTIEMLIGSLHPEKREQKIDSYVRNGVDVIFLSSVIFLHREAQNFVPFFELQNAVLVESSLFGIILLKIISMMRELPALLTETKVNSQPQLATQQELLEWEQFIHSTKII